MVQILQFFIDTQSIDKNQIYLSNSFRMAIYQDDESIFELLNNEDDSIFLDPTVFSYFLSNIRKEDKVSLIQSLFGYISDDKRPENIVLTADSFGLVHLPNLGYIRQDPLSTKNFTLSEIKATIVNYRKVTNSEINICFHPTNHLSYQDGVVFDESIEASLDKNFIPFDKATKFYQNNLSKFWKVIELVTKEIVIFSSPNYNSFAGIMHLGTAFLNVENQVKSVIFFIDDIAHQCGHIIFYTLTIDTNKFLKLHKDHPLSNFSSNPNERRNIYDAFHGLFTYNTILHSLRKTLNLPTQFNDEERYEAIGRIGFYMKKFSNDIQLMDNEEILTEKGFYYFRQFVEGYESILKEYGEVINKLNYANQPYSFQYDKFVTLNPL